MHQSLSRNIHGYKGIVMTCYWACSTEIYFISFKPFYGSDYTMASMTGLWQQSEGIIADFTRCWAYLGQLGIMANEVVTMLEGDTRN